MRVFITRFLGAIAYLVVLTVVWDDRLRGHRRVGMAGSPLHDGDNRDLGGLCGSAATLRAWPELYDESCWRAA